MLLKTEMPEQFHPDFLFFFLIRSEFLASAKVDLKFADFFYDFVFHNLQRNFSVPVLSSKQQDPVTGSTEKARGSVP